MKLDLSKDKAKILKYLRRRIKDYPHHVNNGPGKDSDPIRLVTLGFYAEQGGYVALVFDTRKEADYDGEWTLFIDELTMLDFPKWCDFYELACNGKPVELVQGNGESLVVHFEDANEDDLIDEREKTFLYFTYGSLKKGFPNHDAHADVLDDFVGQAVTRQPMPLVVPKEPFCDNPNCAYLHRMATLVDRKGTGRPIKGEVYRVTSDGLKELDKLEGFHGPGAADNVYVRKRINVLMDGVKKPAYVYVIANPEKYLAELESGASELVDEYSIDMATGTLKPGYEAAASRPDA